MFGRFLEASLTTGDIAASVGFYERLGFTQLTTGDTWQHPYGVLSDGRLCIGLHQRRGPVPLLSFVRPELARDFHELQLHDPTGLGVALLEARTFSPPRRDLAPSLCGWFNACSTPTLDADRVRAFWEHAGFIALEMADDPFAQLALTSDTLTLTLHSPRALESTVLLFTDPQMPERLEQLAARDIHGSDELPQGLDPRANALLEEPEGTRLQ